MEKFNCDNYKTGHQKQCKEQCDKCKNKPMDKLEQIAEDYASEYYNKYSESTCVMPECTLFENRQYNFIKGYDYSNQQTQELQKENEELKRVNKSAIEDVCRNNEKIEELKNKADAMEKALKLWDEICEIGTDECTDIQFDQAHTLTEEALSNYNENK